MPKIKNWSRVEPPRLQDVEIQWEHDNRDSTEVFIERRGSGKYDVLVQDRSRRKRETIFVGADSKEEAQDKAVSWMKKHPNPIFAPGSGSTRR